MKTQRRKNFLKRPQTTQQNKPSSKPKEDNNKQQGNYVVQRF